MFARVRNLTLAGGSALALTILLSGVVAAATVLTALTVASPQPAAPVVDTSKTFEDVDGNGIDDDCQTDAVVANPEAAASAAAAVDANGDGAISVNEAAHSDRVGGTNCNHGGYVSGVATEPCSADRPDGASLTGSDDDADKVDEAGSDADDADDDAGDAVTVDCATETTTEATTTTDTPAECEVAPTEPTVDDAEQPADEPAAAPNAHGKAVSEVAQSDAVGGKNCNHGGAVSEAAKKDHDAARAARDAAKAARDAKRAERRSQHGERDGKDEHENDGRD